MHAERMLHPVGVQAIVRPIDYCVKTVPVSAGKRVTHTVAVLLVHVWSITRSHLLFASAGI